MLACGDIRIPKILCSTYNQLWMRGIDPVNILDLGQGQRATLIPLLDRKRNSGGLFNGNQWNSYSFIRISGVDRVESKEGFSGREDQNPIAVYSGQLPPSELPSAIPPVLVYPGMPPTFATRCCCTRRTKRSTSQVEDR